MLFEGIFRLILNFILLHKAIWTCPGETLNITTYIYSVLWNKMNCWPCSFVNLDKMKWLFQIDIFRHILHFFFLFMALWMCPGEMLNIKENVLAVYEIEWIVDTSLSLFYKLVSGNKCYYLKFFQDHFTLFHYVYCNMSMSRGNAKPVINNFECFMKKNQLWTIYEIKSLFSHTNCKNII